MPEAFAIFFSEQAEIDLEKFKRAEANIIIKGIESNLRYEPMTETTHRKRLRPNPLAPFQLSVEKFRIFYDVADGSHEVNILRIGVKVRESLFIRGEEIKL